MQLRNLEIHGFKTFANATNLEFSSGITAIVGPNGSGKSNVSDALIWVLGEQNVRTLRGGKLQDVIFAGSAGPRPTGMAEVALTFDNTSRQLPLDFNEITITRRVYRSDESEYFINRTPCRLRDIVDLFLDTGIGRESYFALNQGEIDMILSADPEERRSLFEEAAGVKKYRVRKRESLRKLEATEQNLLRIHDLVSEVESRVAPLERQAEAARRYRELAVRLRDAELGAFAADWFQLDARLKDNGETLLAARTEAAGIETEVATMGAEEETVRLALREADALVEAAQREQESRVADQIRTEGRVRTLQEQLLAGEAALRRTEEQEAALRIEHEETSRLAQGYQQELTAVEKRLHESDRTLSTCQARVYEADERWRAAVAALEGAQARAVEKAARQARNHADREAASGRLSTVRLRLTELDGRRAGIRSRVATLEDRSAELAQLDDSSRIEREEIGKALGAASEAAATLRTRLASHDEVVRACERQISGDSSRLKVLEELQEHREGFYKGPRMVLQAAGSAALPGHYRAVADILAMDASVEAALEAALGGSAQDVITITDQEARDGIYFLKRSHAGRATFLSLEIVTRLTRPGGRPTAAGEGMLGVGIELVRFDELYRPIVEMLLGRVVVCDTLENGNRAARTLSHWSRIVTLDGEVISSQGAMTGGSRQQARVSILGRTGQIRELQLSVTRGRVEWERLKEERSALQQQAELARERVQETERRLQRLDSEVAQRSRDRAHLSQEQQRQQREELALVREFEQTQAQEQREQQAVERLSLLADQASPDEQARENLEGLRTAVHETAAERDAMRDEMARLKAEEAGLRERRRSLAANVENTRRQLDRLASEEKNLRSHAELAANDALQLKAEQEALEALARRQTGAVAAAREAAAAARHQRGSITARLEQLLDASRAAHRLQQAHSQAIFALESARAAIEAERHRIRSVLAAEYALSGPNPVATDPVATDPVAAMESADAVVPLSPLPPTDEMIRSFLQGIPPSSQPERDLVAAGRLRRQMRALEPVNLGAIDESAEVVERLQFLTAQRADVEGAARDLRKVLEKIDEEARGRFMSTFGAVAAQFDDLFRQLFGGGQTRLTLTDPTNPSESGIEISAQPPGKKLQNLQLLSGGERSLTAVALLFAMLRVRPVPFCIMDEVDAALDEANVARFGKMLKSFAEKTQFIIITHNRGTMEVADRLYGVTMTEPGISRVLSVTLSEVEAVTAANGHAGVAVGM